MKYISIILLAISLIASSGFAVYFSERVIVYQKAHSKIAIARSNDDPVISKIATLLEGKSSKELVVSALVEKSNESMQYSEIVETLTWAMVEDARAATFLAVLCAMISAIVLSLKIGRHRTNKIPSREIGTN